LDVVHLIDLPDPFGPRTDILAFLAAMEARPDRQDEQIKDAIRSGRETLAEHDRLMAKFREMKALREGS
jgi:hypothetical protein